MKLNQTLFRVSAQLVANGIFSGLDRTLIPQVFLIGFYRPGPSDFAVTLEPATLPYPETIFNAMEAPIGQFEAFEKDNLQHSAHLPEQENLAKAEHFEKLRYLLLSLINEANQEQQNNRLAFCADPVWVEESLIFVVLQFNKEAYLSHYALTNRPKWQVSSAPASLLDATVAEYLSDCSKALRQTEFDYGKSILQRDYSEVLRAAGKRFMYTPAHGLFEACNSVSALKYEGSEGIGSMLLSKRNHPDIYQLLTLETPVSMRDYRSVRKLLELAENNIRLLSDASFVYGLGTLKPGYDFSQANIFVINFTKHYTWEFIHAGHVMMRVTYGLPSLPKGQLDELKFRHELALTFPGLTEENIQKLWLLADELTRIQHGTMVVITEDAENETKRLDKQGFRLEPMPMAPSFIRQLTHIDGAMVLGTDGKCYAIGVILDGLASNRGDAARGARYNSAIRYVESSTHPCLAIVVSEDGLINVIRKT